MTEAGKVAAASVGGDYEGPFPPELKGKSEANMSGMAYHQDHCTGQGEDHGYLTFQHQRPEDTQRSVKMRDDLPHQ